jgi:hypothetical protein
LAINYKIIIITIVVIIGVSVIFLQYDKSNIDNGKIFEHSEKFFNFKIETENMDLIELPIDSIFKISGLRDGYTIDNDTDDIIFSKFFFELDDENLSQYDEIINTDEKTVVIFPLFTAAAYNEPGFYNYFAGDCNETCLTVPLVAFLRTEIGGNGANILQLLNYNFLSDIDIDKNPEILNDFDKVILLHNEYVTKKQFDAITSHPNVIYLYPNALYAEIEVNYDQNTISLIRGHNFPEKEIINGFDWKFDNTSMEYDRECNDWQFYEIDNGVMLNCFPEEQLYKDPSLLKTLREL